EKYRKILEERFLRFQHLPYLYASLIIRNYLSNGEFKVQSKYLIKQSSKSFDKVDPDLLDSQKAILWNLKERLGIDPIGFTLRMAVGAIPYDMAVPDTLTKGWDSSVLGHIYKRNFSPDLIREALLLQPWHEEWGTLGGSYPPVARAVGFYYPEYYAGETRPHDLTDLYFAYREGDPVAFRQAAALRNEPIQSWMNHE